MKLEIGCGNHPQPGYDHLDCFAFPHVEYVADAAHIPLANNIDKNAWLNHKLHGTDCPGNAHITSFTLEYLVSFLKDAGFVQIFTIDNTDKFSLHISAKK